MIFYSKHRQLHLPYPGDTNTFPLRNQSLPLESLKDQLEFLVIKILGGDSFIHKNENKKRPRNKSRVAATPRYFARVWQWWWWEIKEKLFMETWLNWFFTIKIFK
jgi:hypothetical protein